MDVTQTAFREPDPSLVTTTHVTYALHALGLAIGAFGASTMIGTFLFGWPSIIAVIINYVKRNDARGTWLESHFTWQIQTFWFALAWSCIVWHPRRDLPHRHRRHRDLDGRVLCPRRVGHLSDRERLDALERSAADLTAVAHRPQIRRRLDADLPRREFARAGFR